jgi:NTP pyrophosphatase (non-canonical NTP hydrolase)
MSKKKRDHEICAIPCSVNMPSRCKTVHLGTNAAACIEQERADMQAIIEDAERRGLRFVPRPKIEPICQASARMIMREIINAARSARISAHIARRMRKANAVARMEERTVNALVLLEIQEEVERAMRKFPQWPTDPIHAAAVIAEECGELQKATLEAVYEPHKVSRPNIRTEAVQTAAMCLRFLASLDEYEWFRSKQHQQNNALHVQPGREAGGL